MTPRDHPPAEHADPTRNQPQARQAQPVHDLDRPPGRAGPRWTHGQLAAQIQRLGAAPAVASPATQMRQLDTPQLPDLEAEP